MPRGFNSFSEGLRAITEIFHALKGVLKGRGQFTQSGVIGIKRIALSPHPRCRKHREGHKRHLPQLQFRQATSARLGLRRFLGAIADGETLEFVKNPIDFATARQAKHGTVFKSNVLGKV